MIYLDDLDDHWGDEDCCDDPDCKCSDDVYVRPTVTVHLPAEDVT